MDNHREHRESHEDRESQTLVDRIRKEQAAVLRRYPSVVLLLPLWRLEGHRLHKLL